jgi:hypothetical protein
MYETLREMSFCTKGYAPIHIQRPFLDNKRYMRNSCNENPNGEYMLWWLFYTWIKKLLIKKPKSQFLVVFQSFFGQDLAEFGSFGQILLH